MFENKKQKENYIAVFIHIIALLLTAKRAFIIFDLFIFLFMIFIKYKKNIKKLINKFTLITISGIIIILLVYSVFPGKIRVFDRFFSQKDFSSGRFELYEYAVALLNDNLLFGIGINNFNNIVADKLGYKIAVHNVFLQLLTELGLLLGIYVILVIGIIYKRSIKKLSNKANINVYYGIGIQTLFILYFFTGNSLFDTSTLYIYFISLFLIFNKRSENIESSCINIS